MKEEQFIQTNHAYFDKEAADFDLVRKDPNQARDPLRRLVYRYFTPLNKEDRRLSATLKIARTHQLDWNGRPVLELGCGHGQYSIRFAQLGAKVTMVDYSQPMLDLAQRNLQEAGMADNAALIHADLRDFDTDDTFDLVFLTGVTDYLPKSTLDILGKKLGKFARDLVIISFPRYELRSAIRWLWLSLFKGVPLSYFKWSEVETFASQHGFEVTGVVTIPFYYVVGFKRK